MAKQTRIGCWSEDPVPLIENLMPDTDELSLPTGIANYLIAKLERAIAHCGADNPSEAANQLDAFIYQVEAQSGKGIDPPDADILIAKAMDILGLWQSN